MTWPWWAAIIASVVTTIVTVGLPVFGSWLKTKNERQISDAEVGMKLRDELRDVVDRQGGTIKEQGEQIDILMEEVEELRAELAQAKAREDECERLRKVMEEQMAELRSKLDQLSVEVENKIRGQKIGWLA